MNILSSVTSTWLGPFSWPGFETENGLDCLPSISGVYLHTFDFSDGYIIYAAGLTRRAMAKRFKEHTRSYLNGDYNILDPVAANQGVRKQIWHGWKYARNNRDEFIEKKQELQIAAMKQLSGFRIFVSNIDFGKRILERTEASIMHYIYRQASPFCDLPDKGMMLSSRWKDEEPISIRNEMPAKIYPLPEFIEI